MKSKILITAVVIAILGSFAFITIEENSISGSEANSNEIQAPLKGIVKEDVSF